MALEVREGFLEEVVAEEWRHGAGSHFVSGAVIRPPGGDQVRKGRVWQTMGRFAGCDGSPRPGVDRVA